MYVAAAWVALEVAETLTDGFGLPAWFPAFALGLLVLGLPITLATALVQDRPPVPQGDEPERSRGPDRIFRWKNVAVGSVGAFALWGVLAAGWLLLDGGRLVPDSDDPGARPSIAVLPFANLSRDAADAYIADGLHDEILTQLHKIGGLKVISRTSVLAYRDATSNVREIGRELGAGTVLEGTVRVEGEGIRVTAQLIDATTDEHLWAEDYDRTLSAENLFGIQRDLALGIARELRARLTDTERARIERAPTRSMEAYRRYLEGRQALHQWTPAGVTRAIEHFEAAVEEDPEFALAHASLAEAYAAGVSEGYIPRWQEVWNAERAAARALELDPHLGAAYAARGIVRSWASFDWDGAAADYARAYDLDPNNPELLHWYGHYLMTVGRGEEAIEMSQIAVELDPLSPAMRLQHGWELIFGRRYDEARRALARTLELDPSYPMPHLLLAWIDLAEGRLDAALREREAWVSRSGSDELYVEGCVAARRGEPGRVERVIARAETMLEAEGSPFPGPAYELAGIHACAGDLDGAFRWLDAAFERRDVLLAIAPVDPRFDPVRSDPRFDAFLDKMGL